jgi:hypothetical protein
MFQLDMGIVLVTQSQLDSSILDHKLLVLSVDLLFLQYKQISGDSLDIAQHESDL